MCSARIQIKKVHVNFYLENECRFFCPAWVSQHARLRPLDSVGLSVFASHLGSDFRLESSISTRNLFPTHSHSLLYVEVGSSSCRLYSLFPARFATRFTIGHCPIHLPRPEAEICSENANTLYPSPLIPKLSLEKTRCSIQSTHLYHLHMGCSIPPGRSAMSS